MKGNYQPRYVTSREFQDLTEAEIDGLTRNEGAKLRASFPLAQRIKEVESREGPHGHWEEHWITVDGQGNRVYARIYYGPQSVTALTADGQIVRQFALPNGHR
ncbi:MAG: hypothetical protein ACOYD6_06020 [Limnochordia bacterium]|jgi:hypothetical protein